MPASTNAIDFGGEIARQPAQCKTVRAAIQDADPSLNGRLQWVVTSHTVNDEVTTYIAHQVDADWTVAAYSVDALTTCIRTDFTASTAA